MTRKVVRRINGKLRGKCRNCMERLWSWTSIDLAASSGPVPIARKYPYQIKMTIARCTCASTAKTIKHWILWLRMLRVRRGWRPSFRLRGKCTSISRSIVIWRRLRRSFASRRRFILRLIWGPRIERILIIRLSRRDQEIRLARLLKL